MKLLNYLWNLFLDSLTVFYQERTWEDDCYVITRVEPLTVIPLRRYERERSERNVRGLRA